MGKANSASALLTVPVRDALWRRRGPEAAGAPETPVVPVDVAGVTVQAKLEEERPSGSFKGVAAELLVARLRHRGAVRRKGPGPARGGVTRLLISSSGNMAAAVAHYTADDRVRLTVVTDVLSPAGLRERLGRYPHVETVTVDRPDATGSHMAARREVIDSLRRDDPGLVEVDQYDDPWLPEGYACRLAPELFAQLGGRLGAVFVAVGTGGLAEGFRRFRERNGLDFRLVAVDADGSNLARPPRHGAARRLSGYGNGRPTGLYRRAAAGIDLHVFVTDEEAVAACHRQAARGLRPGASGGAVLAAVAKVAARRPWLLDGHGAVAAVLADGGEAYADTLYDTEWLRRHRLLGAAGRAAGPTPNEKGF